MSRTTRLTTLAAATALLLAPGAAPAQVVTRRWELRFTRGVLSCAQVWLTTTPQIFAGTRYGTVFDVALSYAERGASPSALQDVALGFADVASVSSTTGPVSLLDFAAPGGTGGSSQSQRWIE